MQAGPDGLSHRLERLIEKLPEQKKTVVRELLVSLLEPVQRMQIERDSLERLEEKYLLALKDEDSNVLEIRPIDKIDTTTLPRRERRWHLKAPCLIEASTFGEIFRMAFELHLRSSRSIFLSWHDIDPSSRHNSRTLLEMTSCTIFIPEVTRLPLSEQRTLLAVLQADSDDKPHLMAGTFSNYSELQNQSHLDREFLETVSQAYLKLTMPLSTNAKV